MPGFRSLEGRQRRLVIANLAKKNDVRCLTKRAPQPGRKSPGVTSHLSLRKMTTIAGELILDRVLDRYDMPHLVLVHPLKEGRDGGGFPRAGRSRHKNQAVLARGPSGQEPLGCSERVKASHLGLNPAQDQCAWLKRARSTRVAPDPMGRARAR